MMKSVKILIVQHLKPVLCCSGPNLVELDSAGAKSSSTWFGRGQFKLNLIWPGPNLVQLELAPAESSSTEKNRVFIGFLSVFCHVFCCFMDKIYIERIFWKKNESSMLSVAAGATNTKVRPSTGVATTNSTNKNQNANKLSWAIN